ncbi:Isoquinoline 1-oxidoreductase subunit beta [Zhongshania aliphaticivorans]|uniref:Isoquinoline 1-oxidoreductase subunit beta n=1 Tax=Zhongshania aliphaticivorans TaxID=1470434 RepID=A0A5S9NUV7_9GAMM|nr:molybdopterin cofactor-binding domain-containing protein [Zhongshania aliphaticivorans]CAA0088490.1 Isoquinoline 1-oxidoreductase subunit beta [Zhongshania aliphaticivorans]CAA0094495.1 Isoquinoline 1-oxidoreductase subunit beta [Zhongshania aliphaticivorans]
MSLSRRSFIKSTALLGGGLAIGFNLSACSKSQPYPNMNATALQPNAFLQVTASGDVVLQLHKVEMGQGVYTGLTTLAAEELKMDPALIKVEHAEFHPDFRDPEFYVMITGGSSSARLSYQPLREAAATVAALLKAAAAQQLDVSESTLSLRDGRIVHVNGDISFADVIATARTLPAPAAVTLTSPQDFQYIGRVNQRLDAIDKVTGNSQFGIDVTYPEALTAVMLRSPSFGGKATSFDAVAALAKPGVKSVINVDGAIAVIAQTYWQAKQAASAVTVTWGKGPLAGVSSESLRAERHTLIETKSGKNVEEEGEQSAAVGELIEALYDVPYLAHATMEPMNAVAVVTDESIEIWTGNQSPDIALSAIADATGHRREQIRIHNQMLGGGFGRRIMPDYLIEAARIAQLSGYPIKLVWSREDDMRGDYYRPNSSVKMSATIDGNTVTSLQAKVAAPSIMGQFVGAVTNTLLPQWLPNALHPQIGNLAASSDPAATEGLVHTDYDFPYKRTDYVMQETSVPIGYWRSVGHSQNGFFMESFIDELAARTKQDPLQFRLDHLPADSSRRRVLEELRVKADWGNPVKGQFQGLAVHESFQTMVGQCVSVSIEANKINVHSVVCVVDCGLAINPDIVTAQMEGGIVFALTAALKGDITIMDGAVQQSNFHDYELLRMNESPDIVVHIMENASSPTGVGEPGVPPLAPALANAVFAATGQRLRQLPLKLV